MAKIFQFDNSKVERKNQAEAMDASAWFSAQQPLLLWMANKSKDGRQLLRLDQVNLPRIDRIAMNHVGMDRYVRDGGTLFRPIYRRVSTTDFRVGAKWANLVNSQWDWFCELSREYYSLMEKRGLRHVGQFMPVALYPGFQYGSTTTVYPVLGANSPCDGVVNATDATWSTARNATSGVASVSDTNERPGLCSQFSPPYYIYRGFFNFDTSGIADTDEISAGVLSLSGNGVATLNADTCSLQIVAATPAGTNTLVGGDFDNIGSTVFATMTFANWVTTNNTYNDFTLDANGRANISKTAVSSFGARNSRDTGNTAPTGQNAITCYFADGNTAPKLVVTHAAAAVFLMKMQLNQAVKRASYF